MVHTTHPGNIGSAARAMKTMGLSRLVLVQPLLFPHAEATALASGAADLLESAQVVPDLGSALAGVHLVVGTSARQRHIPWPRVNARHGGEMLVQEAAQHEVAVVFGREDRGLTNEELHQCHVHLEIPTNPDYGVLNVAAAMQVVCYELRMAYLQAGGMAAVGGCPVFMPWPETVWDEELVPHEAMPGFYEHLEQAMTAVGFLDVANPRQVVTRVRRLFQRMRMDRLEYNLLRGFFKDILQSLAHREENP